VAKSAGVGGQLANGVKAEKVAMSAESGSSAWRLAAKKAKAASLIISLSKA
jgi:hypothetical protein